MQSKPKTIFISSFHPAIFRNILATDVLKVLLKRNDIRIVIFTLKHKKSYFESLLNSPNISIEGIPFDPPSKRFSTLVMKRVARLSLDTLTARVEKLAKWKKEKKFFYYFFASILGKIMSRSSVLRKLFRFLDYRITKTDRYGLFFEKYNPSLVLVTDIQNERDVELLQSGKDNNVSSYGMVRNWDNLTSHGIIRLLPDKLIVQSEEVKKQALKYNDLPEKDVFVTGIPHYDKYFRGPKISKKEFLRVSNLNTSKKTIFYSVIGDAYLPNNNLDPYILDILSGVDAQVFVRFSPTVPVKQLENIDSYTNMFFDRPGVSFNRDGFFMDRELSEEDDTNLMTALYYSDLIVSGPSTISLDAIFFDKPVILIDFYKESRGEWEKILKYRCDHLDFIIKNRAVKVAKNEKELIEFINLYLNNPQEDSIGRMTVRGAYCGPRDGKSGNRLANLLLKGLES